MHTYLHTYIYISGSGLRVHPKLVRSATLGHHHINSTAARLPLQVRNSTVFIHIHVVYIHTYLHTYIYVHISVTHNKFKMRLYVVITSTAPLRAYLSRYLQLIVSFIYGCISMQRYWSSLRYSFLRALFLLAADYVPSPFSCLIYTNTCFIYAYLFTHIHIYIGFKVKGSP